MNMQNVGLNLPDKHTRRSFFISLTHTHIHTHIVVMQLLSHTSIICAIKHVLKWGGQIHHIIRQYVIYELQYIKME